MKLKISIPSNEISVAFDSSCRREYYVKLQYLQNRKIKIGLTTEKISQQLGESTEANEKSTYWWGVMTILPACIYRHTCAADNYSVATGHPGQTLATAAMGRCPATVNQMK